MIKSPKNKQKTVTKVVVVKEDKSNNGPSSSSSSSRVISNKQKDFERCSGCPEVEVLNLTRFAFRCGHWFHQECYELAKIRFNGGLCPMCHYDERFDFLNNEIADTSSSGKFLILDIDHSFAKIASDMFYDEKIANETWSSIESMSNQRHFLNIEPTDIELYSRFDPNDHESLLKKANYAEKLNIDQKKIKKMRKVFEKHEPIDKILVLKYSVNDIKSAGITLEFLVSCGYNIVDIYHLGFRRWKDLKELKFSSNIMTMLDDDGFAFISVQFLVDYYHITYRDLIMVFSYHHLEFVKNKDVAYQKAILELCKLNLKKDELVKLSMTNINALFSVFGKNCFNADCLVEFCKGEGINKIQVLQQVFKFDGSTIDNIVGFNTEHLKNLGWQEGHLFGDLIRENLMMKYGSSKPSSSNSNVHDAVFKSDEDESNSEEEEEEEEDEIEDEDTSSEEDEESDSDSSDEPEPIPGISFSSRKGNSLASSTLPKAPRIPLNLYNNNNTPVISQSQPQPQPVVVSVARKRDLE